MDTEKQAELVRLYIRLQEAATERPWWRRVFGD
jgi:hypothetical protein